MSKQVRKVVVVSLIALLLVPQNALAWSDGGHRIVALIAWRTLKPQTRAKVRRHHPPA